MFGNRVNVWIKIIQIYNFIYHLLLHIVYELNNIFINTYVKLMVTSTVWWIYKKKYSQMNIYSQVNS